MVGIVDIDRQHVARSRGVDDRAGSRPTVATGWRLISSDDEAAADLRGEGRAGRIDAGDEDALDVRRDAASAPDRSRDRCRGR